jgi:pimeloyl-ACP methyl ester carboxylesterase
MKKILIAVLGTIAGLVLVMVVQTTLNTPDYAYHEKQLPESFDDFYQQKLAVSAEKKARPNNEERLIRYSPGKTPVAFMYVHGYKACRAEGEAVVDALAEKYRANTYYVRLPGHGTNMDDQAATSFDQLLDESIDAARMMRTLGDKVIIVGTSMGALLTTYMLAEHSDVLDGAILVSPFYNFDAMSGKLMFVPAMYRLVNWLLPLQVDTDPVPDDPDNWTNYWYKDFYTSTIRMLVDLSNFAARDSVYRKVEKPVAMFYYYKDETHYDDRADISAMKHAYGTFAGTQNENSLNTLVRVENASHTMLSRYSDSDKETIVKEMSLFVDKILAR